MAMRIQLPAAVLGITFAILGLHPGTAAADPVTVTGFLSGDLRFALIVQDLNLRFPTFSISIPIEPQLNPRFCIDGCGDGTAVPFTQTTGPFSGHSSGLPGLGTIDADVSGTLSFTGPTEFVHLVPDLGGAVLTAPVQLSGLLRVARGNGVLFDGTLAGSGTGTVVYETRSLGNTRLGGYQYAFSAVATTPEPASMLLVATGAAWLGMKRRIARKEPLGFV